MKNFLWLELVVVIKAPAFKITNFPVLNRNDDVGVLLPRDRSIKFRRNSGMIGVRVKYADNIELAIACVFLCLEHHFRCNAEPTAFARFQFS